MSDTHAHTVRLRPRHDAAASSAAAVGQTGAVQLAAREPVLGLAEHAPDDPVALRRLVVARPRSCPGSSRASGTPDSLTECREILDATLRPGAPAPAWRVIPERWHQLLFGFYPQDALLAADPGAGRSSCAAVAPILFQSAAAQAALASRAPTPSSCFWLLWGGTSGGRSRSLLGFVLGWRAPSRCSRRASAPSPARLGRDRAADPAGGCSSPARWRAALQRLAADRAAGRPVRGLRRLHAVVHHRRLGHRAVAAAGHPAGARAAVGPVHHQHALASASSSSSAACR